MRRLIRTWKSITVTAQRQVDTFRALDERYAHGQSANVDRVLGVLDCAPVLASLSNLVHGRFCNDLVAQLDVRCHEHGILLSRVCNYYVAFIARAAGALATARATIISNQEARRAFGDERRNLSQERASLKSADIRAMFRQSAHVAQCEARWRKIASLMSRVGNQDHWRSKKAEKIQKLWRLVITKRQKEEALAALAATAIQKVSRMRLANFMVECERKRWKNAAIVAVPLQARWRGTLQRMRDAEIAARKALREAAMTVIQACVRGWLARRLFRQMQKGARVEGAVFLAKALESAETLATSLAALEEELFGEGHQHRSGSFESRASSSAEVG